MSSIELTAPAKVNLVLKVFNKRKDGYHNLLTLFERISLSDLVTVSMAPSGISITCDRAVVKRAKDNIAYKAAELILKTARVGAGVRIDIRKRIPVAAGLGGGSSDAAATLIGINRLFNINMGKAGLMRLGAKLGADVPFFIFDTPFAVGRGIGDRLKKADLRVKLYHLLIYPGFKVATKDVYKALDLGLTMRRGGDKITLPKDWSGFEGIVHNDLEDIIIIKRPVIGKVIQCLVSSLGRKAMVSGSGPSVFCLYRTRREAVRARDKLFSSVPARLRRNWQVFIVETV
ncbi:MAG: 4-(cytidine 5'-diphospho)-2-C-methyl-D-erythritol kinase [Candidatus Omnitrophica bacterium]|nr:4-(cytidine 5'-diphospho)-2-C-methyl-D-erythritol kinase [Candidatus Omnitrophota bacterium]